MRLPLQPEVLAYAAGIVDGEGCIGFRQDKRAKGYSQYVRVSNTDPRLLAWLKNNFEGSIFLQRAAGQAGKVRTNKDLYSWVLYGHKAAAFLSSIRPYMIVKSKQADCAILLQSMKSLKNSSGIEEDQLKVERVLAEIATLDKREVKEL